MSILVAGDNPIRLGGHADHNPFRLWVKERFKRLLAEYPDAELYVPLHLGPGTWCAEVAVEQGRPFHAGLVASGADKWYGHQIKHHDALALASRDTPWNADQFLTPPGMESPVLLFVAWDGECTTSQAARVLSALWSNVVQVTPSTMPPPYVALGIMEEARDIFSEKFHDRWVTSVRKLHDYIETGALTGPALDRAKVRLEQMVAIHLNVEDFMSRGH